MSRTHGPDEIEDLEERVHEIERAVARLQRRVEQLEDDR